MASERRLPRIKLPLALVLLLALPITLAACAGAVTKPRVPDETPLQPALTMLDKAEAAGAARLAPDALRAAQRRLGLARGVIYRAATENRDTTDFENSRIKRLVEEAAVDARLALALTQQEAVSRSRAELQKANEAGSKSTP